MLIFFIILLSCFAILYFNNVLTKFLFLDDPTTDTPPPDTPSPDTPQPPPSDTPSQPPPSDTPQPSPSPTLRPTPRKPPPPILPRTKNVTKPKLTKTSRPTQSPSTQPPTQQPQPSTTQPPPSSKTVEQLIDDFKKTGQQLCSCEHVFHSVIRDHKTNANFTSDTDKKCLDLAKAIMATSSNNMQQVCTYRDKIFHPQCRGPSLNGGRCS